MTWALVALPWLAFVLLAVLLLTLLCYWPLRLDVSLRARGTPDGGWVVAGGLSLPIASLALVWGRGLSPQLSLLVFGRKLSWNPRWGQRLAAPVPKRMKAASRRAWKRVDPLSLGLKLLEERRHLRLRYLVVDLAYGFRDPLLTGRLVAALSVLSVVLPAAVELRQAPRWDFEDGWDVTVDGRAVMKPWLMLLDVAVYVVRQMSSRPAPHSPPLAAEGPTEVR
jgi:hypothetical protein